MNTIVHYIRRLERRRIEKLPITDVTKESFKWLGAFFGFNVGVSQIFKNDNGFVWRPTAGAVVGGTLGYTIGLFPYHAFGLILLTDAACTYFGKAAKS